MTDDDRPRARPDVVFRRVGGDWLLYDPRTERIHVLNLTAALVWSHCTGEVPVSEIRAALADAFPDPVEGAPVEESLERFRREGLLAGGGDEGDRQP